MIDTVHVRVPALSPFGEMIAPVLDRLHGGQFGPFAPSRFYESVGSLTEDFGIDAILHLGYKRGSHAHKVEILGAGKKSLEEMAGIIRSVFDVDPNPLSLMRADFNADIEGVPVCRVRDLARFEHKRFASQIGKSAECELEFVEMGTVVAQSFYVGRRPNCFRVYNKFEELRHKWRRLKRNCDRFNEGLDRFDFTPDQRQAALRQPPTFEEYCRMEGFEYTEGTILTRIERQIGGDRFPSGMETFGDLYHSDAFDPFEGMTFIDTGDTWRTDNLPDGASIRDLLAARGLLGFRDDFGSMQHALSFVMKNGNGNGRRILDAIIPLLPPVRLPVSRADIVTAYLRTTKQQIGAPVCTVYT